MNEPNNNLDDENKTEQPLKRLKKSKHLLRRGHLVEIPALGQYSIERLEETDPKKD
jgi:hypothetical protein